jgi:hypothetical protein
MATTREILDRVAERILIEPRARIVNRAERDAILLADVLRVIEETAAEYGEQRRHWDSP